MQQTVVLNVVGLTRALIGEHTPRIARFVADGRSAPIGPVLPAVTTTVQSTYLTGALPAGHGIVGNGWYFRDECEVKFWRQSDRLVQRPRIWETARRLHPEFTCANLFWWYAMYCSADVAVTPRPMYPADGRKLPDIYTQPAALRHDLQAKLGQFPLFSFWGPATSIAATQWIADCAIAVDQRFSPTLSLVYLPHLDYGLQRHGPDSPAIADDLRELDGVVGQLLDHFQGRGARVVILSEYGIVPVRRPVHINRILRQAGLLTVRDELGLELLDAGASDAFAVADHQLAHVYVNNPSRLDEVRQLLRALPGVGQVLNDEARRAHGLDHPRSGELVVLSEPDAWFTYYYWLDDARAPDFARTVDIHRKPGYDPVELFLDPSLPWPKLKIARRLLARKLGFRNLLDVIPLDATLVKGSHGLPPADSAHGPLLISSEPDLVPEQAIPPTQIHDLLLRHVGLGVQ